MRIEQESVCSWQDFQLCTTQAQGSSYCVMGWYYTGPEPSATLDIWNLRGIPTLD